jgi:hypothetical protein
MSRLVVLLVLGAVGLGFGVLASGADASITTTVTTENYGYSDTAMCGFELDWTIKGSFKNTFYYNTSGQLVKIIVSPFGGPFTVTVTNPANGNTARTQSDALVVVATFNPDGSPATVSLSGIDAHMVMRGAGPILVQVGTVAYDAQGNILRIGGPHQYISGDFAGFCAAMAG